VRTFTSACLTEYSRGTHRVLPGYSWAAHRTVECGKLSGLHRTTACTRLHFCEEAHPPVLWEQCGCVGSDYGTCTICVFAHAQRRHPRRPTSVTPTRRRARRRAGPILPTRRVRDARATRTPSPHSHNFQLPPSTPLLRTEFVSLGPPPAIDRFAVATVVSRGYCKVLRWYYYCLEPAGTASGRWASRGTQESSAVLTRNRAALRRAPCIVRRRVRLRCQWQQRVPGGLRADRDRGGVPHRGRRRGQDRGDGFRANPR
jgi:hypothetical protein